MVGLVVVWVLICVDEVVVLIGWVFGGICCMGIRGFKYREKVFFTFFKEMTKNVIRGKTYEGYVD